MRYLATFLIGSILGGVSVFLYLQRAGKVAVRLEPRVAAQTTSRAEVADDLSGAQVALAVTPKPATVPAEVQQIAPPALPPAGSPAVTPTALTTKPASLFSDQPVMSPEETVAIPVVGIRRQQLRDTFTQSRSGGRLHDAIDILAPRGTPIVAAIDGKVVKLFMSAAGGITVYEMDPSQNWMYYYAHLDHYASDLVQGKNVAKGEVIGYVGTTGNAPPGTPHLHFAVSRLPPTKEWWKGQAVNPYPLLMQRGVTFDAVAP